MPFARTSPLRLALLSSLVLALPLLAAEARPEPARASTASDAALAWGPCPPFLPTGCRLAVLHGDPAQPNVDVFLELPGRSEIPPHWHTSAERMVLVAGELRVAYDGQPEMVLRPGSYAYGPAKLAHRGSCSSEGPCVLFIAFEQPLDAVPVEPAKP